MKKFAAFFYGYFYFFGFSVEKVRVFFAANKRLPSVAYSEHRHLQALC